MATDARERERKALEAAQAAALEVVKLSDACAGDCEALPNECATKRLLAAIPAYGSAVREADLYELRQDRNHMCEWDECCRDETIGAIAAAIEALKENK